MKYSKYVKILERENLVILINTRTRAWYRMSKNIFDILNYRIEKKV